MLASTALNKGIKAALASSRKGLRIMSSNLSAMHWRVESRIKGNPQVFDVVDQMNWMVGVCRRKRRRKGKEVPNINAWASVEHYFGVLCSGSGGRKRGEQVTWLEPQEHIFTSSATRKVVYTGDKSCVRNRNSNRPIAKSWGTPLRLGAFSERTMLTWTA